MMSPSAPDRIDTDRLVLRRPRAGDAAAIYARYASDPAVTRWVGWPRHTAVEQTEGFLGFAAGEWTRWPAGPYLIERRADGLLIGSTGFGFESPWAAMTGYVLATDAWGQGYATEALRGLVGLAPGLGIRRLFAYCHAGHAASAHVLEKCGFAREGVLARHTIFPNSGDAEPAAVLLYARTW
jgi:RimJ/RimL family protein N-acetyltransferase